MDTDIVDMDLMNLLTAWHLPHLYSILHDNRITIDVLKILEKEHITKLCYNMYVGDEALFLFHLKKFKSKNKDINDDANLLDPKPSCSKLSDKKEKLPKSTPSTITEMLEETKTGRDILKYYIQHNVLHEEQRNLLINTISLFLQEHEIECSVSKCCDLEKEICSTFPTEKLEFYQQGKRGKIYNKVSNAKRIQKGILTVKNSSKDVVNHAEPAYEPEDNCLITLKLLRSENVTAEEFDIYWRQCAQYRFKQMLESQSTNEILELWPEYAKPSGIHLIEIDFLLKFPMAKDLKTRWEFFETKVLYYLKTKISSALALKKLSQPTLSSNTESKTFTILWCLHYVFPPQQKVAADEEGAKYRKKHSIVDSQESFAVIADSQDELDAKMKLLKLQKKNVQPKLLIVGDISNIKSISIYFDGLLYPFLTILTAVDVLFKIFYVFNLQYPEESELFYSFLQDFFYEIPLKKKIAKISTVKNDITNLTL